MYTIIANTFHFRGNNLLLFYYTEHMLFKIHSLFPIYGFFLTTLPITFPLHYPMTRIWYKKDKNLISLPGYQIPVLLYRYGNKTNLMGH